MKGGNVAPAAAPAAAAAAAAAASAVSSGFLSGIGNYLGSLGQSVYSGITNYGNIAMDYAKKLEYNDLVNGANNTVYAAGILLLGYGAYKGVDRLISLYKKVDKYLQKTLVDMNNLMKKIATMNIDKFMEVRTIDSIKSDIDDGLKSLNYVVNNFNRVQEEFANEKIKNEINLSLISYDEVRKIRDNLESMRDYFNNLSLVIAEPGIDITDIRDKYYEGLKRATHVYKLLSILLLSNSRVLDILEKAENAPEPVEKRKSPAQKTKKNRR
jgi:hypothetical protein